MSKDDVRTPVGLLQSLRMLADEARAMALTRTLAALQQAMETCRTEAVMRTFQRSTALH